MIRALNRWQHKLFSACFHLPEDMGPLKNHPWQNRFWQNRALPDLNNKPHQPRILKEWQNSIASFVERHTVQK